MSSLGERLMDYDQCSDSDVDEAGRFLIETGNAIQVWRFQDAPERLQRLSNNGGDEDWLALIPVSLRDEWISWLEEGGPFGCCDVQSVDMPDGSLVKIGSHA